MKRLKFEKLNLTTFKTFLKIIAISYKVNKLYFFGAVITGIILSLTPVLSVFIFSKIVDQISHSDTSHLFVSILLYGIVLFLEASCGEIFSSITWSLYRFEFSVYFSDIFVKKIAELDIETIQDPRTAEVKKKADDSVEWAPSTVMSNTFTIIRSLLTTVVSGIAIFVTFPLIAVLLIISVLPSIIVDYAFKAGIGNIWESDTNTRRQYGQMKYINEYHFKELKLLNISEYFRVKLIDLMNTVKNNQKGIQLKRILAIIISGIPVVIVVCIMAYNLATQVTLGIITLGTLTFFISNLYTFKQQLSSSFYNLIEAVTNARLVNSIFEFFSIKPKIVNIKDAIKDIDNPPSIEFKDVSFKYLGSDNYVFKNFNLKINRGEKIAIVGENGVGKSTLVKLLLRFYDVTDGDILINGINLKNLDLDEWRRVCGVLLQDFEIFDLPTIEDNIGFGNIDKYTASINKYPDTVSQDIIESAKYAKAQEFILKNKDGYNAVLGRDFNGVSFSGGERQRIALARTFYRDAGLVIMDEPTSAVDAKAEFEIFESIKNHLKDKTVIFVSHRFSTVRIADRIVVIENGKIEEDGTHDELIQHKGVYENMFTLQAEGYK